MELLWEAGRLATLPAAMSARAGLWMASCSWEVLVARTPAPAPALAPKTAGGAGPGQQPAALAKAETSRELWPVSFIKLAWGALCGGLARLRRLTSLVLRVALALSLACVLYAMPVCGASLRAPLHFLPGRLGAEAVAEAEVGLWAAALAPGRVVVDVELELTIPNSQFNLDRVAEALRVDLDLAQRRVSRPLVFPQLPPAARQLRELLWTLPMAFGLAYDEESVTLPLATGLLPQELVRHGEAGAGFARLGLAPALAVRTAQLRLQPRFAGPLGRPLGSFFGFVPICAALLYLGLFRRSEAPPPHEQRVRCAGGAVAPAPARGGVGQLTFVEVQLLAKALGGAFATQFPDTLRAFEAEDCAAHGGKPRGLVKIDKLPMITGLAQHEWQVSLSDWELRNIIGATLTLPPAEGGLVSPGGLLQYRLWLAVTTVALCCGDRKLAVYAEWLARHAAKDAAHAAGGR